MKRFLTLFLLGFVLLTQFGLVAHAYQDHAEEEVCHLCLTNSGHDHAIVANLLSLPVSGTFAFQDAIPQAATEQRTVRYYAVRAPPRFL